MNLKTHGWYIIPLAVLYYLVTAYIFTTRFTGFASAIVFGLSNGLLISAFFYLMPEISQYNKSSSMRAIFSVCIFLWVSSFVPLLFIALKNSL